MSVAHCGAPQATISPPQTHLVPIAPSLFRVSVRITPALEGNISGIVKLGGVGGSGIFRCQVRAMHQVS